METKCHERGDAGGARAKWRAAREFRESVLVEAQGGGDFGSGNDGSNPSGPTARTSLPPVVGQFLGQYRTLGPAPGFGHVRQGEPFARRAPSVADGLELRQLLRLPTTPAPTMSRPTTAATVQSEPERLLTIIIRSRERASSSY